MLWHVVVNAGGLRALGRGGPWCTRWLQRAPRLYRSDSKSTWFMYNIVRYQSKALGYAKERMVSFTKSNGRNLTKAAKDFQKLNRLIYTYMCMYAIPFQKARPIAGGQWFCPPSSLFSPAYDQQRQRPAILFSSHQYLQMQNYERNIKES